MRKGPIDSALGPDYNTTQASDPTFANGRYNVCVCEPKAWGPERGNCPSALPSLDHSKGQDYVGEAVTSLCINVLGAAKAKVSPQEARGICQACAAQ
jgi:hypothetical protein